MQNSTADVFAFLDDDAQASDDWLKIALALFLSDEKLAVIGGPALLPANSRLGEKLTYKISHAGFFGNGHENLKEDTISSKRVLGYITSCNMFVWPSRLGNLDHFDVRVGYGGEDTLFLYRIARSNACRILYSTSVVVYHSRGRYGVSYLWRRFGYRINNGMMILACPRIYLENRKFSTGIVLGTILLTSIILRPSIALAIFCVHQLISLLFSLRYLEEDWRLTLLFPPALLLQHVIYYAGILIGFLSFVHPRQFKRIAMIRESLR